MVYQKILGSIPRRDIIRPVGPTVRRLTTSSLGSTHYGESSISEDSGFDSQAGYYMSYWPNGKASDYDFF